MAKELKRDTKVAKKPTKRKPAAKAKVQKEVKASSTAKRQSKLHAAYIILLTLGIVLIFATFSLKMTDYLDSSGALTFLVISLILITISAAVKRISE